MNEKELLDAINKISHNEIKRLRTGYRNDEWFNNYLFKTSEKIFKRLVFPYFRFEILLNCIADVNDNHKFYPAMKENYLKKVNYIFEKLQKICLYLNIALEEYNNMLSQVEKLTIKKS